MRIVIATGGTGGHIFPALQTACILRDRGHEIFFIGSLGLGEERVRAEGFKATVIRAQGVTNRSLVGLIKFGWSMFKAIVQSIKAVRQVKPDKVIGFGGYGSFAVVLSAKLFSIPSMIHEQNVVPGKANRLLAKLVKKIAISFPGTRNHFNHNKTVWTGCPCHQNRPLDSREVLLKKFSLDPKRKTILVLGGSQGSQKLNEVFFEMISDQQGVPDKRGDHQGICSVSRLPPIQAIHMTGKKEYSLYENKYRDNSLPVRVFEFISPIEEAYALADVVIARAGAATVSEVGFFAIPSIFIPYPLADGHQKYNAQVLSQLGLASIIDQKDLTKDVLEDSLKDLLLVNFDRISWQKKTEQSFKSFPAQELAQAVEDL